MGAGAWCRRLLPPAAFSAAGDMRLRDPGLLPPVVPGCHQGVWAEEGELGVSRARHTPPCKLSFPAIPLELRAQPTNKGEKKLYFLL